MQALHSLRRIPAALALAVLATSLASCAENPAVGWRVLFDELPSPLLSAWEAPGGVLFAVGGNASRSLVLRHDADGWWEMDPGTSAALWWVHGRSADDVLAV